MIVYPAIDIRAGKVVRLREGDPSQQTTYSDDPVTIAQQWIAEGAHWLHVVSLDGALGETKQIGGLLRQIAALSTGVRVQFGGGLRSIDDIAWAFDEVAARVVLGTAAVQRPELVDDVLSAYDSDAVCIALDSRDDRVTTHGWQQSTDIPVVEFGRSLASRGIRHCLYTDIARDGALVGVNVTSAAALARSTGLQVIASGGVSSLDDVRSLVESEVVAGVVIGKALYEQRFRLSEALAIAGAHHAG